MSRKEYVFTIVVGNNLYRGRTRSRRLIASLIYESKSAKQRYDERLASGRPIWEQRVDYLYIERTNDTHHIPTYRDLTYITAGVLQTAFDHNQWGWNRSIGIDHYEGRII